MVDDMVMRSVYLRPSEDSELRQLAHELNVTKSDLIRSAIGIKLREWLEAEGTDLVMRDLNVGRRDTGSAAGTPARPATAAGAETASTAGHPGDVEAGTIGTVASPAKDGTAMGLRPQDLG